MTLSDIKLKRLMEAKATKAKKGGGKQVRRDPKTGAQVYTTKEDENLPGSVVVEYDVEADGTYSNGRIVSEGEKKHHTPKFVQHCVSAITEQPKDKQPAEPFGVCNAQFNKDKPALAAKHAKGSHHTVQDYQDALEKLREAVELRRRENVNPRGVSYRAVLEHEVDIRNIRYSPWD